jgi:hypothetical protein
VLQQKQRHAQVFHHAFDAKAQWQLEIYTLLTISLFLLSFGLGMATSPAWAVTEISFCDEITQPGSYRITQDLVSRSSPQCILIDTSNVTLDLQGHTITGDGSASSKGISNAGNRNSLNIEVGNGSISNFGTGIDLSTAVGVRVEKVRLLNSVTTGIQVGAGATVASTLVVNGRENIADNGIRAGQVSIVLDNLVGGFNNGITAGFGSIVRANNAAVSGINIVCPSLVSDNIGSIANLSTGCRSTNNLNVTVGLTTR